MSQQKEMLQWANDTFGPMASDKQERIKRFAEEAIELCQACGLSTSDLAKIIMHVYSKEKGNKAQELGQTALSLSLLAEAYDLNANVEMACEFDRVRSFGREYWQARQNNKADIGIGGYCDK